MLTMMLELNLVLVGCSQNLVSAQKTDYVVIPPSMSMDDFNNYVSYLIELLLNNQI